MVCAGGMLPAGYGPHKTIYNRFIRWSRLGVFNRILAELAARGGGTDKLMIDATHLKAHRTAASLLKKGLYPDVSDAARGGLTTKLQVVCDDKGRPLTVTPERGPGQRSQNRCRGA